MGDICPADSVGMGVIIGVIGATGGSEPSGNSTGG